VLREIAIIGGATALVFFGVTTVALALKPKVKQVRRKEIIYHRDPEGRIVKVEERSWVELVKDG